MKNRAGVVIKKMDENKILVFRRVRGGKEYYTLPGGTIEEGESPREAAMREAEEESSLCVTLGDMIAEFSNQGRQETYFWVEKYTGELALGGEEKERMNKRNQYHLEWKGKEEFAVLEPFYPTIMKEKILARWLRP